MGKIHDRIKQQRARINAVVVPPELSRNKANTAREISAMLSQLTEVRALPTSLMHRHERMQELAVKAKRLGLKGRWNLLCNRTQCLRPDAIWYNRGSYAFYCAECASMLNRENRRDAEEFLGAGEPLCIRVADAHEAVKLHVM